jgi:hypothetical protein
MPSNPQPPDYRILEAFVGLVGVRRWTARLAEISERASLGPRAGKAIRQRHAIELTIERMRHARERMFGATERDLAGLAAATVELAGQLSVSGRRRLGTLLADGLTGDATLVPLFHLMWIAALQRARGFMVHHAGLSEGAPFDLLLTRDGVEAELACDMVSAEDGRHLHRGAWFRLADRIDPDLQIWLAAHPGRYLLKMTLASGLRGSLSDGASDDVLPALHARISAMLAARRRADHDEAAVLRLDPLLLTAAQADELRLSSSLRREFGPEAQLAVIAGGGGIFVMAAHAGRDNDVAAAVRRRLEAIAPTRLTGKRPGILAMFVEDTDRSEWRTLRERLELEGETRQFLASPGARRVVAVTCASRIELFGLAGQEAAADGELRFRNPAHPSAGNPALTRAIASSM